MNMAVKATQGVLKPGKIMTVADKIFTRGKKFTIEYVNDQFSRGSDLTVDLIPMLKRSGYERIDNFKVLSKKAIAKYTNICNENGMEFVNLPIDPVRAKKSIIAAKKVIANQIADGKKTFGHCTYGKHRTGIFMALVDNMANGTPMEKAVANMKKHGWKKIHEIAFFSGIKNLLSTGKKAPYSSPLSNFKVSA